MSSQIMKITARTAGLVLLAALAAGCGGEKADTVPARQPAGSGTTPAHAPADSATHAPGHTATDTAATGVAVGGDLAIAGLTFTPPAGWENLGPREMRQAQYRLASVSGDAEPAEVNVFYFGSGQGGDVEANLERWAGQMSDTSGAPERSTFEVNGLGAHLITVEGAYSGGMGGPTGGGGAAKPGHRLVGVVVEAPQGNVFFKLTGPVATARAMETDLMAMVRGARTAG